MVTVQAGPVAGTTTNFSIVAGEYITVDLLNAHIFGNQPGTWNTTSGGAGTYTYTVAATSPCSVAASVNVIVTVQDEPNTGIFKTTVTSSDFMNGAKDQLIGQLCYTTKNGKVFNVTNKMFYYTVITAPSDDFYVDIEETKSESGPALFEIFEKNQMTLWDSKNNKVASGTQTVLGKGQIHIIKAVQGEKYVLSVIYDTKSIIGSSFSGKEAVCTYTFVSKINGNILSKTSIDMMPNCSVEDGSVLACGVIKEHNAFSPNGDGINDVFVIDNIDDTICYPENIVEIYNRWGVLVYETKNYNNVTNVFDGSSKGRATISESSNLPSGIYFYLLNYSFVNGKGNIETSRKEGYLYLAK
jgi:gliding motility-associated-like protein